MLGVCVCVSGRGECRSALAYARLGSLYSRAPLTRRLCNLTRPWRRAPGCVLARRCLRTLWVRLRRIFPSKCYAFLRCISRQSPDCRRGRVHRPASRRPKRVRLTAAAFPAQHIRSALSQGVAVGAAHVDACAPFGFGFAESPLRFAPAHFRLQRIPAGRRVRMRRGLPSSGSVGIPPVAGSAASRLPPSASPAVTASASCRRPSCPLRSSLARGR